MEVKMRYKTRKWLHNDYVLAIQNSLAGIPNIVFYRELPIYTLNNKQNTRVDLLAIIKAEDKYKAIAYEIKSNKDKLNKLARQCEVYSYCFATVTVVTGDRFYKKALKMQDELPGVSILYGAELELPSTEYTANLRAECMLDIMRLKELELMIKTFSKVPATDAFTRRRKYVEVLSRLSVEDLYQLFLERLYARSKLK